MGLFSRQTYLGLDLGHHTLKAAQVERTPSGWKVTRVATAPTPADTLREGVVVDPPVLGLAIKQMLREHHISASAAGIAVSGGSVVVRPVRIPKMAESALRKSIRFEASRYVPNSVEDSYIEFEIIGDVDDTNMDVIVAAAPKELINSRVLACQAAGLDVEHVEIGGFASYRALIEAQHDTDWTDKTIAAIDLGSASTNLSVIHNGTFSMTRAIPSGAQVFTDALISYFKLTALDAESGKSQLDVAQLIDDAKATENPPLRVLHSLVDDLVREIRRSINYWQSQQGEGPNTKNIEALILVGGGAKLKGLRAYVEHKLGIRTLSFGVFDNPRFVGAPSEDDNGVDLGIAVGLAMGLSRSSASPKPTKPALTSEGEPAPAKQPKVKPAKAKRGKPTLDTVEVPTDETLSDVEGPAAAGGKPPKPPKEPRQGLFRRKPKPVEPLAETSVAEEAA